MRTVPHLVAMNLSAFVLVLGACAATVIAGCSSAAPAKADSTSDELTAGSVDTNTAGCSAKTKEKRWTDMLAKPITLTAAAGLSARGLTIDAADKTTGLCQGVSIDPEYT